MPKKIKAPSLLTSATEQSVKKRAARKAAKKGTKLARKRVRGNFTAARSFRMHQSMLDTWDSYCDLVGISRTELLRRFIAKIPAKGSGVKSVTVRIV